MNPGHPRSRYKRKTSLARFILRLCHPEMGDLAPQSTLRGLIGWPGGIPSVFPGTGNAPPETTGSADTEYRIMAVPLLPSIRWIEIRARLLPARVLPGPLRSPPTPPTPHRGPVPGRSPPHPGQGSWVTSPANLAGLAG